MTQSFKQPVSLILRISHLHTDIFLMLSGFLISHSLIKKLQKEEKIKFISEIFNRYLRLIPNVAFMIIFMIFIAPHLGSGPLWPMLINFQSQLCAQTWWRNFLMVQNLMNFEEICMMNTHHIATDFQLSLIGPIIAVFVWKFPRLGGSLIVGSILGITGYRFWKSFDDEINVFVSHQAR